MPMVVRDATTESFARRVAGLNVVSLWGRLFLECVQVLYDFRCVPELDAKKKPLSWELGCKCGVI